jgi:hypothetical protein
MRWRTRSNHFLPTPSPPFSSLPHPRSFGLTSFKFGCHRHEGGLFTSQQADGIMGLGTGELSIIPALWASGKLTANVFSLCLADKGGALTLGAVDVGLHETPAVWASLSTTGFYVVGVRGFHLTHYGSEAATHTRTFTREAAVSHAGWNSPHTILDSGTTFTYVPTASYSSLRGAIATFCAAGRSDPSLAPRCRGDVATVRGEPLCYRLADPADIYTFPGVLVLLGGADGGPEVEVDVPPQHLFLNMGWDT